MGRQSYGSPISRVWDSFLVPDLEHDFHDPSTETTLPCPPSVWGQIFDAPSPAFFLFSVGPFSLLQPRIAAMLWFLEAFFTASGEACVATTLHLGQMEVRR